jgi:hypothetical protein
LPQLLHERASMLRLTIIACLVLTWHELKFPSRQKVVRITSCDTSLRYCISRMAGWTKFLCSHFPGKFWTVRAIDWTCDQWGHWLITCLLFSSSTFFSNLQLTIVAYTEVDEVSEGVWVILPSACPQKSANCTVVITVTEICKHSARILGWDLNPHLPLIDIHINLDLLVEKLLNFAYIFCTFSIWPSK